MRWYLFRSPKGYLWIHVSPSFQGWELVAAGTYPAVSAARRLLEV